jgi:hypothetical protein
LLLGTPLLDGTLDGPLGLRMTSVGTRSDLRDTSRVWLVTGGETVVSSVVSGGRVGSVCDTEEGKQSGEESETVGEHFECVLR